LAVCGSQQLGQQEGRQQVGRQRGLVALGRRRAFAGEDPGVVDEDVDPGRFEQPPRELPHAGHQREIGEREGDVAVAGRGDDLVPSGRGLVPVAPHQDQARAELGQLPGGRPSEARRGAGDHHRALAQRDRQRLPAPLVPAVAQVGEAEQAGDDQPILQIGQQAASGWWRRLRHQWKSPRSTVIVARRRTIVVHFGLRTGTFPTLLPR
jgi:hypothetical protein